MANETMKLKNVRKGGYGMGEEEGPDDYDPHLFRKVDYPTTNTETLIHLLKGSLGTGILAMPKAFWQAGMLNAFVSTFLIGVLCTYCLHLLVQAQYVLCKRLRVPILTYPESMKLALESGPECLRPCAKFSPILVDFFLVIYQLGICCCYVLFVGENLRAVVNRYMDLNLSLTQYMLITFIPFVLINCIRNLKLLAPFSTLANVITFLSFGVVCYYVFQNLPDITVRPAFGGWVDYPLFFGTTLFALEAVGVVIALENNMKTPKSFGGWFGVLNIGMTVITILYAGMGAIGYWKYGKDCKDSITLNFPETELLANSVKLMYALAIFISYGLQGYVPVEIMWKTYIVKHLESSKHMLLWEYILRIIAVILTFIAALTIPLLGLFISLFGAFCLSALGIIFPAIMELCVRWPNRFGPGNIILIKDIVLILFGIVGLTSGTYAAMNGIVTELQSGKNQ